MSPTDPSPQLKKRHQALVTLDRIEEALTVEEFEDAHDASERLLQRIEELQEMEGGA